MRKGDDRGPAGGRDSKVDAGFAARLAPQIGTSKTGGFKGRPLAAILPAAVTEGE